MTRLDEDPAYLLILGDARHDLRTTCFIFSTTKFIIPGTRLALGAAILNNRSLVKRYAHPVKPESPTDTFSLETVIPVVKETQTYELELENGHITVTSKTRY